MAHVHRGCLDRSREKSPKRYWACEICGESYVVSRGFFGQRAFFTTIVGTELVCCFIAFIFFAEFMESIFGTGAIFFAFYTFIFVSLMSVVVVYLPPRPREMLPRTPWMAPIYPAFTFCYSVEQRFATYSKWSTQWDIVSSRVESIRRD